MAKKVPSKLENHALAKATRSTVQKSILDISELNIACSGGTIELWGRIRPPRGQAGIVNMKKEFEHLKDLVLTVRGVREVNAQRVIVADG